MVSLRGPRSAPWMTGFLAVSVTLILLTLLFAYQLPSRIPVFPGTHFEEYALLDLRNFCHCLTSPRSIPSTHKAPISIQEILRLLYAPLKFSPNTPAFTDDDGKVYRLPENQVYDTKLGKKVCILDLETRPLDKKDQLMHDGDYSWKDLDYLSGGVLNHYTYGTDLANLGFNTATDSLDSL